MAALSVGAFDQAEMRRRREADERERAIVDGVRGLLLEIGVEVDGLTMYAVRHPYRDAFAVRLAGEIRDALNLAAMTWPGHDQAGPPLRIESRLVRVLLDDEEAAVAAERCPACGIPAGTPCLRSDAMPHGGTYVHVARVDAWRRR